MTDPALPSPWLARLPWMRALRDLPFQDAALASAARLLRLGDKRAMQVRRGPLDALELAVLAALVRRLCPVEEVDVGATIPVAEVLQAVEQYLHRIPPPKAATYRDLLVVWEYVPWIWGPRRARFTDLDAGEQHALLERWSLAPERSRRAMYKALRTPPLLAFWTRPATWPFVGFTGPTISAGHGETATPWDGAVPAEAQL